jgi:hypothetical protein
MEFEVISPVIGGSTSVAFERWLSELRDVNPIGEALHRKVHAFGDFIRHRARPGGSSASAPVAFQFSDR